EDEAKGGGDGIGSGAADARGARDAGRGLGVEPGVEVGYQGGDGRIGRGAAGNAVGGGEGRWVGVVVDEADVGEHGDVGRDHRGDAGPEFARQGGCGGRRSGHVVSGAGAGGRTVWAEAEVANSPGGSAGRPGQTVWRRTRRVLPPTTRRPLTQ